MSRDPYCARCKHPKSDHHNGMCAGMVREETPKLVFCDCKSFVPKHEDANQAAARIVKESTRDK